MTQEERTESCPAEQVNEAKQVYVTLESARGVSYEVARKHFKQYYDERERKKKLIVQEILDTHLKDAVPTEEEKKKLTLTSYLTVYCEEDGGKDHALTVYTDGIRIKPLIDPVEISLPLYLSLKELEEELTKLDQAQYRMYERLLEELMYTRDKEYIECAYPQLAPKLVFKEFYYDTHFWQDILSSQQDN